MKHSFRESITLVTVETVSTRDYTLTTLLPLDIVRFNTDGTILVRPGTEVVASGTARKHPDDKLDTEVGVALSLGRAFRNFGNRHIKRGNGLVKHADDMKIAKATHKAKPARARRARAEKAAGASVPVAQG